MIKDLEIYQLFQNRQRIVIFLDNARAHISDFARITIHDIVIALDESTIKTGIGTKKKHLP